MTGCIVKFWAKSNKSWKMGSSGGEVMRGRVFTVMVDQVVKKPFKIHLTCYFPYLECWTHCGRDVGGEEGRERERKGEGR